MNKCCENCKSLRKKISMLEKLISLAQPEEWDLNGTYDEIIKGTPYSKPDKSFAKWFAKRFNFLEGDVKL